MVTHSSVLAWGAGGLQSMGLQSDTTERWGRVQVAQLPLWIFRGRGSLDKNYCLIAAV